MVVHAATAEWLQTLPWWDWRGWSDWFYGGQAVGVNYPPLAHAWLRLTHPFHGQMAAVATGLLVLLPWGSWRLARAAGLSPRAQRVSLIAVMVLASASGGMHWVLSGFHAHYTFFGSWPAMLAIVCGLFAAAWAANCRAPAASGVVTGVAGLLNASYVPATAVVCAVLLATSGASLRQAARWAATSAAAAISVCGWWLVPFVAGWGRLVGSDNSLSGVWRFGGLWQEVVLAAVAVAAVWGALRSDAARRLALAGAAGLAAAWVLDLAGYQRAERLLDLPILVTAGAAAGLVEGRTGDAQARVLRPVWALGLAAGLVAFALSIDQHEVLPLALWLLLWRPGRDWVWGGALAWFAILSWIPLWAQFRSQPSPETAEASVMEGISSLSGPDAGGLVHLAGCDWTNAWRTTIDTGGRIRVLGGLYGETSASEEFITAAGSLAVGAIRQSAVMRPHWNDAWQAAGAETLDGSAPAYALGARWHAHCDDEGNFTMHELPVAAAEGVRIVAYPDEDSWHRAAAEWWIALVAADWQDSPTELAEIPVLWSGAEAEGEAALVDQAARGLSLRTARDRLYVTAESAGWAWLRIPWDPWWFAGDGVPLKGGSGHLVVWVEPGVTELRWSVPGRVDASAVAVTALSLLMLAVFVRINRRLGWDTDPGRPRPITEGLDRFARAADGRIAQSASAAGAVLARAGLGRQAARKPRADEVPHHREVECP